MSTADDVNMFWPLIESSIVEFAVPDALAPDKNFFDSWDKLTHYMPPPAVYVVLMKKMSWITEQMNATWRGNAWLSNMSWKEYVM